MRVVFDANVYISAFIRPDGPPGVLLRKFIEESKFDIILSEDIILELKKSLNYPRIRKYIKLTPNEVELMLTAIGLLSIFVKPVFDFPELEADPDDTKYIKAAIEGNANYIVSGDKHLLNLVEVEGIEIVTSAAFLKLLNNATST